MKHITVLTLFLMTPACGMEQQESQKEIIPLSAKIQAGVAAAAPLLIYPPLMIVAVPAIAATMPHVPDIATRASTINALTMPAKAAATIIGDNYIAPHSSMVNWIAKFLAGLSASRSIDQYLTDRQIIPSEPTPSTLAQYVCHTAVGYAVGSATEHIIYAPYDRFMKTLSKNYKNKAAIIATISATSELRIIDRPVWDPSNNPATEYIKMKSIQDSEEIDLNPQQGGITCELSQAEAAIVVREAAWHTGYPRIFVAATKYTTDNTQWYYLRPFGASTFSKEIKQLHRTVFDNHVTATGVPLKDIIQAPADETIDL